jgi:hypothetical protein
VQNKIRNITVKENRMRKVNFRKLNANEIDVRIGTIGKNKDGLSLLLYKDARVDMNILDETIGSMYWKREHSRDNQNCIVSLWNDDIQQWVSKEDTGTESFTEKEKGVASDSFKRACFNWGIGRELYTAPFIWVTDVKITDYNGKASCNNKFTCTHIAYDDNGIVSQLVIKSSGKEVYSFGVKGSNGQKKELEKEDSMKMVCSSLCQTVKEIETIENKKIDKVKLQALIKMINKERKPDDAMKIIRTINESFKIESMEDLTEKQHLNIIEHFDKVLEKAGLK